LLNVGDRVVVSLEINETTLDGGLETIGALGIGGLPELEELNGGQAEFRRVPFASDNCIVLAKGTEHELDYVLLADIFPTSNFALDSAGFQFGDVVAVFGVGECPSLTRRFCSV
jgi:threonine dehydrogenase-like Zn-dependent dehydrogenase